MKHNQSVEINHSTKTVILTKKFLLAANRIGTPEFNELMTLRTQFADYTFEEREIKKNPTKQTYGKLTYAAMKDFIKGKETKERAATILKELDTVIDLSQAQKASYVYVKKWFLNLYKEDFKTKQQLADEEHPSCYQGYEKLVIPEGITSIGDYALYRAYKYNYDAEIYVSLPTTIKRIGDYAFSIHLSYIF